MCVEMPTEQTPAEIRRRIIGLISDRVADLMYYDRKEDEGLPVGAIEQAIEDGVITIDEMVAAFRENLAGTEW